MRRQSNYLHVTSLVAAVLATFPVAIEAAVIRYDFQGTVVTPDPGDPIFGDVQPGQPFSGWFVYDDDSTSNPDQRTSNVVGEPPHATIGWYDFLEFVIEGNSIVPDGINPPLAVLNNFSFLFEPSPPLDGLAATGIVPGIIPGTGSAYSVLLYDTSTSLLSSDALTDVGAGHTPAGFNLMQVRRDVNPYDPWPGNVLFGTIHTVSGVIIPEPSSLALLSLALPLVHCLRRRRSACH